MEDKNIKNKIELFRKIAEVSHLHFLFGAGTSDPFIEPMPKIEEGMDTAEKEGDVKKETQLKREFFNKVIYPCLKIKSYVSSTEKPDADEKNLTATYENYKFFLIEIVKYLLSRKTTLLNKQINLFTTNIDVFFERVLEDFGINYNDGFLGHMNPVFRTSNFQTIVKKKSEYSQRQSEIPTFNLYKLHGSLTWKQEKTNQIGYSDLSNLDDMEKLADSEFKTAYEGLHIINPNRKKFVTSVLESTYYDLFRLYASELEKENSLLFVSGFSFNDSHILHITRRVMDSNPTLTVCIFCHSQNKKREYEEKFAGIRYPNNLHLIASEDDEKIDLKWVVENIISQLNPTLTEEVDENEIQSKE